MSFLLTISACSGQQVKSDNNQNETGNIQTTENIQQQESNTSEVRIMPGHIVMMAIDLDRTRQFYEEHLNFRTTEELVFEGLRRIFMSASGKHHELVLLESTVAEFPPIEQRQLQQVAFEVPTHDVLVDYYKHIKQTDIPHVIKDNQVSLSLYFTDPNEVTVEIYWDITDQPFGEQMWNGNQEDISEEKFLNPFELMNK
ncbi:MAG: VOC family protein [Prolixibacteraceae bacterium]